MSLETHSSFPFGEDVCSPERVSTVLKELSNSNTNENNNNNTHTAVDTLHFLHRVLLHQWEHDQPAIVLSALQLLVEVFTQRGGELDLHNEDHLATLDQLANQCFSLLAADRYCPSAEIYALLCKVLVWLVERDQRYVVKLGGHSVGEGDTSMVSVLETHRRAIEAILCADDGGFTKDAAEVTAEERQLFDYRIAAVRGLCEIVSALCISFDNQLFLGSNGVCEELTTLLSMDFLVKETSDESMESIVAAVSALANNTKNRTRLGELGMSTLLLRVLERHHETLSTLKRTSTAIRALANEKLATEKVKLGAAGACPVLSSLLKRHKDNEAMTAELCWLISVVAEYWKNKIEFSEAGAYETLFVVLKLHKQSPDVLEPALRALSAIAVNKDDQFYLKECGVCDLVVELLRLHTSHAGLAREACASIWTLALNDENHVNFLDIDTCELLWKTLQLYGKDVSVLEQILGAMETLMRNQQGLMHWKFTMNGDDKNVLVETLMLNATFPDILEKISRIFKKLAGCEEFRLILTQETFVYDVFGDCMEFHANNARLCKIMEETRNKFVIY